MTVKVCVRYVITNIAWDNNLRENGWQSKFIWCLYMNMILNYDKVFDSFSPCAHFMSLLKHIQTISPYQES